MWLQTAEKQPPISNVRFTLAWHFSFWMVSKPHRNLPGPLLTAVGPEQSKSCHPSRQSCCKLSQCKLGVGCVPSLFAPSLFVGTCPPGRSLSGCLISLAVLLQFLESCTLARKRSVDLDPQICLPILDILFGHSKLEAPTSPIFYTKSCLWNLLSLTETANGTWVNDTLKTI